MQELYGALFALLLVLLLGLLMQKRLKLGEGFYQGVNTLVIRVTLPALIVVSMDKDFSRVMARNSLRLIIIGVLSFAVVIAGLEIWRRRSKIEQKTLGLYQYLILIGNTAFMGYPIVRALYGSDGVFYASVFNLTHNFVTFSYGISLLMRGRSIRWRDLLQNSCLMATFAGAILFISPFRLPGPVNQALADVGGLTIPLCLLMVGARLADRPVRDFIRPLFIWKIALVRLVLFPLIMIPALRLLGQSGVTLAIPCLLFATPVALTAATFAEAHAADAEFAGKAVIVSNLLALATLPIVTLFVA